MAAVKKNELSLKYTSTALKCDKIFVLDAAQENGCILQYASDELNNKEVILAAVQRKGYTLDYASDRLRNDKEVVVKAIERRYLFFMLRF